MREYVHIQRCYPYTNINGYVQYVSPNGDISSDGDITWENFISYGNKVCVTNNIAKYLFLIDKDVYNEFKEAL